jgi:hypothetical protein
MRRTGTLVGRGITVFASSIIDVVIGLAFVFFVCSLAVSGINELVRKLLNTRAKVLWTSISSMLEPSETAVQSERTPRRWRSHPNETTRSAPRTET